MIRKSTYSKQELLVHALGLIPIAEGRAPLPAPPLLGFDRVVFIDDHGGSFGRGQVIAEKDVVFDEWTFLCHFRADPVLPGCLGLDALWQMCGFFMVWSGCRGHGRALGVGSVDFQGEIRPHNRLVTYEVSVKKLLRQPQPTVLADGIVKVDDKLIYECKALKSGLFDLPYAYPHLEEV
jgi:3-hydroxyacyl-[acyl-carrier protein] dehydratase/trans-2-decenoyl-[acyl-carrier protein] isomerase